MCNYFIHLAPSYNQPQLCSSATWDPDASTFANSSTVGTDPYGIFVNTNNTVYIAERGNSRVQMWLNGSIDATKTISNNISSPLALFVTSTGDVYVGNDNSSHAVNKWESNLTVSMIVMNVNSSCYGLFVDINNTLHCSLKELHQVIKLSLNGGTNISTIAAGNGSAGSTSTMLSSPYGIFVTTDFDLYVADCGNDRVQLFASGQLNGTTVPENGTSGNITLNCPTGVVLDGDNYLFIVDSGNNRIVGSGPNGFRCLVGCNGSSGSASNQLSNPQSMVFDRFGNIFVTDRNNSRVQKFIFVTNSCGMYDIIL
jgi:hypothetical protein